MAPVSNALNLPQLDALTLLLSRELQTLHTDDIEADIDGEKEALPEFLHDTTKNTLPTPANGSLSLSDLEKTILGFSKGVTDATDREYLRLADACVAFLLAQRLISSREGFICKNPSPNAPLFIISWIMQECDSVALDGSEATGPRHTYSYAQKMRASMTYIFARMCGAGHATWSVSNDGTTASGNPSVSSQVATYMLSLRRRKVQQGEAPTSARAITSTILKDLYDFNHRPEHYDINDYDERQRSGRLGKSDLHDWGGPRLRRAAQAIYTLAFLCLLRVDEVLKIKMENVEFVDNGSRSILILTLPFRKTHQFGEVQPFFLQGLAVEEAHLCPVRAVAEWIKASRITTGYLFPRMTTGDRIVLSNSAMSSQQFLEIFRNNLIDINIDPAPYGTHSFRRGGCQYLSSERRWLLRRICEWGGWSTEFSNLTIVKYLLSWNDNPTERREDFFNPDICVSSKCWQCGRSCDCS